MKFDKNIYGSADILEVLITKTSGYYMETFLIALSRNSTDLSEIEEIDECISHWIKVMYEDYKNHLRGENDFILAYATPNNRWIQNKLPVLEKMRGTIDIFTDIATELCPTIKKTGRDYEGNLIMPSFLEYTEMLNANKQATLFGSSVYKKEAIDVAEKFEYAIKLFKHNIELCKSTTEKEEKVKKDPAHARTIYNYQKRSIRKEILRIDEEQNKKQSQVLVKDKMTQFFETCLPQNMAIPLGYHLFSDNDMNQHSHYWYRVEIADKGLSMEEITMWDLNKRGKATETLLVIENFDSIDCGNRNKLSARTLYLLYVWSEANICTSDFFNKFFFKRYKGSKERVKTKSILNQHDITKEELEEFKLKVKELLPKDCNQLIAN